MSRTNNRNWISHLFPRLWASRGPRRVNAARGTSLRVEHLENRVTPSGLPPTATAIPRQAVNEDAAPVTLHLGSFFTDPENDTLTYSVVQSNTMGLVTPSVTGADLKLTFGPNQYGYSYFQVMANDGSNTTTAAFEVLVNAVDDLTNDTALASKTSAININVLANDGAVDGQRLAEAGNMDIVQNDTGNNVTSVTETFPQATPNVQPLLANTSRGDFGVQIGTSGTDDVANGLLFSTVRQNTRDNNETTGIIGPNVMTSMIDSNANGYWVPTSNAGPGGEYNVNTAVAYFSYAAGWVAGWAVNAAGTNGDPNDTLRTFTPNSGLTIGTAATALVQDQGNGLTRVKIPGVNSATDGVLLAIGAKNEDNYSMAAPNADGSWEITTRDNGSNGTNPLSGNEQDYTAFVYIPKGMSNAVSGRIMGDGSVQLQSGNYTVTHTGTGTYQLSIPGQTPLTGVLMISPEGGTSTNTDNFTTYEADPDGSSFDITSWDIVSTTKDPVPEDVGATTRMASFVFIPFMNVPTLNITSVQSTANVANTSDMGATLTINPDGTVGYDPSGSTTIQGLPTGQLATDKFTYTTTTLAGITSTATVTVTIGSGNSGSVVDLANGTLSFSARPGVANNLTVADDGTKYTFTDPADPITLTPAAITAGFTGSGTNTISGPTSAVTALNLATADLDDTITLNGLDDPFTIDGGGQTNDALAIANALTFTGNASVKGVANITAAANGKMISPTGTITLTASNAIGTASNPVLTKAGTLVLSGGAGGILLTEDDGATATATAAADGNISLKSNSGAFNVTATATGAGNIDLTDLDGTLNIAGATSTALGNITLTSGDAITLSANLNTAAGLITIAANTDGTGSEGYDQKAALVTTGNTTSTAYSVTVNTAAGGSGNAVLGAGTIGTAAGGDVNVNANGGSILWSSAYTIPDIATSNTNTLHALDYSFITSGAASSVGTAAAPIQTDNIADFGTATLAAGSGGAYQTDWGTADLVFASATATGAGNVQLIAANASGHNLSVLNANTGSGSITLIADDDMFIGSLNNAPVIVAGFIGDDNFSGTISMLANRDGGNEQRIIMRPGSIVQTKNTTANAILMRSTATDNSPTDTTLGGITITTVKAGDGGTITLDTSPVLTPGTPPTHVGSILQQDDTTVGLDAGPTGTVILNAGNGLNGTNLVNLAALGDATSPIRVNAGTIKITAVNTPVRVAAIGNASVTATIIGKDPVNPTGTVLLPAATLDLSSETGVLTIAGPTNTDGGPITLTSPAGIVVNGVLGDANTGNMTINASPGNVTINANLTVNAAQTVTLSGGNRAILGPATTVNGTLIAPNGVQLSTGDMLQGAGTVNGSVTAAAGTTTAAGPGPGTLALGDTTINGKLGVEINSDAAGTGYDQLNVTGAVNLTRATLDLSLGYVPVVGATYTIVNNDGSDPVIGTFSNTFPVTGGRGIFSVKYNGGDGNDVVLTVVNIRPIATFDTIVPNPRAAGLPSETVTFSEPVTGFDAADLSLTRDGTAVPLTGVTVTGSGASYTISGLATLTEPVGAYVLTLNAASSGIQDLDTPVGSLFANASVSWSRLNNVAPVLDNTGAMALGDIVEDAVTNSGTLVSAIIASAGGDRITDANNDPDGIAVTAVDNTNGTWQYSTDGGATWLALSPVSDTASRLLAADAKTSVRFVPNADFFGKVSTGITFRAWDQSSGTAGGVADTTSNGTSTSFSSATETASVYVMNLPDPTTVTFQDGLDGYDGTDDTELAQNAPDDPALFGSTDPSGGLLVDYTSSATSADTAQVLLRFNSLFGTDPGQIPLGSIIVSAVLTVTTNNTGNGGTFNRMNVAWDESTDTWNTFGDGNNGHNATGGVQANNVEASSTFDSFAGPTSISQLTGTGRTQFGVTADLQAWSNGEANNGWAILPWTNGTDGWAFHSSEAVDPLDRPTLTVEYLPAGSVSVVNLRQGVDGYTGTVDTEIRQDQPDANRDLAGESFIDFNDGNNNQTDPLLRFNDLVGTTPLSVPAGAIVDASALILPSTGGSAPGDGGTFNRMLVDWSAGDSWNQFASGANGRNSTAGIQPDNVEAATAFNFQAGNSSLTPDAQAAVNVFDATTDVQAWVNGAGNYGWVGLPWNTGSNGWSFNQSEQDTEAFRPELVAYYTQPEHEFAQLDIAVGGALSFVGGGGADGLGIADNLAVSLATGTYTFADPNGVIVLTPAAIAAGWTGSGTNTVTGPSSSVHSIQINTGSKSDTITIAGADDPISVNGGFSGGDTIVVSGSIAAFGDISLFGVDSISQTAGTMTAGAGTIYLAAPAIGTSANRIKTAAGSLNLDGGSGGVYVTETDDAAITWAAATGTGVVDIAATAGALAVSGIVRTETGAITLDGSTGVVVDGSLGNAAGVPIAINGALSGTGVIAAGSGAVALTQATNSSYGGTLTGSGSFTKAGAGTLTLANSTSRSGATSIVAGALVLGNISGSATGTGAVNVNGAGTLTGTGIVTGSVTAAASGTIAPGTGLGKLDTGNFSMNSGSTYKVQLNGAASGTLYDQVNVAGTVKLNSDNGAGATLDLSVGYVPAAGDSYVIINNDNADAVTGTFAGLPEGATVTAGTQSFTVSYVGGDGNDVVLTSTSTNVATTTNLVASPLATTGGSSVMFTATIAPSPGALGTVTFLDNGTPIPGGSNIAVVAGQAIFSTTSLSAGSHPVTAAYSGAIGFASSSSTVQNVAINSAATAPSIVGPIALNGGLTAFAGDQHSRVINLQVVFDQAVQLDTDALTLALHTNGIVYNGGALASMGTVPTLVIASSTDKKTWTVTFTGTGVETGADGFASLTDGVYDFKVDATKVHPVGNAGVNMAASSTLTFHRLFGDVNLPAGTAPNLSAVVNTTDNLQFRTAFGNLASYKAYLDFNGDGQINTSDNFQFRTRFSKTLSWKA